jgi:type 1 glutamine amidotransferase
MLDCPLRDEPYSVQSPLMDILLNPAAKAIANRHLDGLLDKLPPFFASTEVPSFSAIMDLTRVAAMGGVDLAVLPGLDRELGQLELTDADRADRCRRYDDDAPELALPEGRPRLLLFQKITGFRDGPSVEAATATMYELAREHGWCLVETDRGGVMTPESLTHFDAVIWNNISGDVLTLSQREAFRRYIEGGGGFVGIHGSGGDPVYFWDWYRDTLLGAQFIGHPMDPQFQDARVVVEDNDSGIAAGLAPGWTMNDEWYSFAPNPHSTGATVVASLDESSYSPVGQGGQDLRMGYHPIAWTRSVGSGRSFYSAIGHRPQVYADPNHRRLLVEGIQWAAGNGARDCGGN